MARTAKAASAAPKAIDYRYAIRTWEKDGTSHGGFQWDVAAGARTEAPDWLPTKECGNGLHANPWAMGDWSLLADLGEVMRGEKIFGLVRYDAALAIDLDGKDKAPWMEVVLTTRTAALGTVLGAVSKHRNEHIIGLAAALKKQKSTKATTGDRSAAATTGNSSAAATTGDSSAASALGRHAVAASLGAEGRAKAGATGAIMLAAYKYNSRTGENELKAVFAGMVGQTYGQVTVAPDTYYRLTTAGALELA